MPIIRGTYGHLTKEKKAELIKRLVEVSVEVTGTPEHAHYVVLEEVAPESFGVGTKTLEVVMEEMKKK